MNGLLATILSLALFFPTTLVAHAQAAPAPFQPNQATINGSGQQAVPLPLAQGAFKMDATYQGPANFIVTLLDGTGQPVGLLANTIGAYKGSQFQNVPVSGNYVLQVQASGPWTMTLQDYVTWPSGQPVGAPLTGHGPAALAVQLNAGLATFSMSHDGQRNFIVTPMDSAANPIGLLANTIGPFTGSQAANIASSGVYLFNIEADGNWVLGITQ